MRFLHTAWAMHLYTKAQQNAAFLFSYSSNDLNLKYVDIYLIEICIRLSLLEQDYLTMHLL